MNKQGAALKALEEQKLLFTGFSLTESTGEPREPGAGYNALRAAQDAHAQLVYSEGESGGYAVEKWWISKACCCIPATMCSYPLFVQIDDGCIQAGKTEGGNFFWFGQGVHMIWTCGLSLQGDQQRLTSTDSMSNGSLGLCIVEDGYVGLISRAGEKLVLPPGIHHWSDPDVSYEGLIDLSQSVVEIGVYTLVIVEEGYAAITSDNGKQVILGGGQAYMLNHANWNWKAWMSLKMQTNKLPEFEVTSSDNIQLTIRAHVNWIVVDPQAAAAKNTDVGRGDPLSEMRGDINLQVRGALVSLLGRIHFGQAGAGSLTNKADGQAPGEGDDDLDEKTTGDSRMAMYDPEYTKTAVDKANQITLGFGVRVLSVNIIRARPKDMDLMKEMTRGAVATVKAMEQKKLVRGEENASLISSESKAISAAETAKVELIKAETASAIATIEAEGKKDRQEVEAKALLVGAKAQADAIKIKAEAEAEAERIRAEAAKVAGDALAESDVAVALAKLKIAYEPLQKNQDNTFFFGLKGAAQLPTAIMSDHLVKSRA